MYSRFNIEGLVKDNLSDGWEHFLSIGSGFYSKNRQKVESVINSFVSPNGKLNGTAMQSNWFPKVDANIFLSHSHKDEQLAIALSGWLHEQFGLSVFIDSCVWGYSNNLLHCCPLKEFKF